MNFVSVKELNQDIINNLYKLPRDIDVIVGIPRSGILVATLIALYLNKPLADLDSIVHKEFYHSGGSKNTSNFVKNFNEIHKILVVEDSAATGRSLFEAKDKIKNSAIENDIEIIYLIAYVTERTVNFPDIYYRIVPFPRAFEWNIMHHGMLQNTCMDIDGILCEDPTNEQNDDGDRYRDFLSNAKPKFIPTANIGWLVTSRLEKYRQDTESWLQKYHISYDHLIMMKVATAEERRKLGNHAEFKASIYRKLNDAELFIESEPWQAEQIHKMTGKTVYCPNTNAILDSTNSIKFKQMVHSYVVRGKRKLKKILTKGQK